MKYDPFQQQAIDYIDQDCSVLVAAPTGAGKTAIAEHVMHQCLRNNQKVIYTAPIKALSNQKYRDFLKEFPNDVGILTGDVTINQDAPLLIMTTEIFRNKILEDDHSLDEYKWIVFDEIHYLDDFERGSVWEESLIFLPDHMRIVGLSATVPNIRDIAKWLEGIHDHPFKIIQEDHRPVPLHISFYYKEKFYDDFNHLMSKVYSRLDPRKLQRRGRKFFAAQNPDVQRGLIEKIKAQDMLPCVYFCFSRRRTEFLAKEMYGFKFLTDEEAHIIQKTFQQLCQKYDLDKEATAMEMKPLIERGIAYHHAGMLPSLKEVIEQLFTSRLIKVIFTTETFALGINMPAKAVVFDEMCKFNGQYYGPMKTRDFYQMAGRAGRRGIDKEGHVFCCIDPYQIEAQRLHKIVYHQPEKVESRFNATYATLLNLYQHYGEKLYDIYPYSLHYYQTNKRARKQALNDLRNKVKILKENGYIRKNSLTKKGLFATKIFGYEIMLAELYEQGILERLSQLELAILAISIVYEPRKGVRAPAMNKVCKRLKRQTQQILAPILKMERRARITPLSKMCYFHLADAMEAWIHGEPFDKMMELTQADEGEVVRYFRMTIQILRELLDTPIVSETKDMIRSVLDKINRDVVDSEKQLNVVD